MGTTSNRKMETTMKLFEWTMRHQEIISGICAAAGIVLLLIL